ncbi:MAG: DUF3987 domain-containing protein [Bacteroidota bacterium]|nr:DUF3987 domain-containing protein [Bacteroidota bacterium]
MASSTIFKQFNIPVENKSLIIITKEIIEGKYKNEVKQVRAAFQSGNKEEADKLKKQLLAFTPSATYGGGRKLEHLLDYSQFIILEIDKLTTEQLETAFKKAIIIPYTFSCFRSPSGNGIKILVQVNSHLQDHKQAYLQVADHYQREIGFPIDPSGKDVTRLCFVSYDPQAYRNINSQEFKVNVIPEEIQIQTAIKIQEVKQSNTNNYDELFHKCIDFTNQKSQYIEGNRNNYIHLLACNCNRSGIPVQDVHDLLLSSFDLDAHEIKTAVESAYLNQKEEFAKFALPKTPKEECINIDNTENGLLNMPTLPDGIFEHLPGIIKYGCSAFETSRERDIFLTGAITILSGCFSSVEGTYDQKTVYPNLNCFIIAPAASGKGALIFAKALGQAFHDKLYNESKEEKKKYDILLKQYKMKQKNAKRGEPVDEKEEPEAPPFKILFIPGNSSSAAVIKHLMDGDEKGIFCETEADTMGQSFKQDWGGYSDLLRKAFHHESISYSRKTNNEYSEIKKPRLSVALSGTPSQVQSLISSAEDGLFSRFIFYTFKVKPEWRDVSPATGKQNLTKFFEQCSLEVLKMIEFLEQYPTEFNLTPEQWHILNQKFKEWLKEVSVLISEEATSTVKRLGLIVYRIAMVLSATRKFENADCSREIICEDQDFETAFKIAEVFKHHAMVMFTNLPKTEKITDIKMKQFFEALPLSFQRKDAVAIGKQIKIEERTTDKYLKQLLNGVLLTQPEYGQYAKL